MLNSLVGCNVICHNYSHHEQEVGNGKAHGDGKEEEGVKQEKELCKQLGTKVDNFLQEHGILPKSELVDHEKAMKHGRHLVKDDKDVKKHLVGHDAIDNSFGRHSNAEQAKGEHHGKNAAKVRPNV
jgi:hypothetical protein